MVMDAFTDLVFTPDNNPKHVALQGLTNEENDSTQPTDSSLIPPSPRDIGPLSFLNSPRYLLASPNATLEQPITSPINRSSPGAAVFPLHSPLPPLTPLPDLPTPQHWGMISPTGQFTPSLFFDTPNSLSRDQENDKLSLAATKDLTERDSDRKDTDQRKCPTAARTLFAQVSKPKDNKDAEHNKPRFIFSRNDNVLTLRKTPLDVRRRLFDEGTQGTTEAETNTEQQLHKRVDRNRVEPQPRVRKGTGLKSRITAPPPIAIPANPLSRFRIREMPKRHNTTESQDSHLSQGNSVVPHASSFYREQDKMEGAPHISQRVEETIPQRTVLHSGENPIQTDDEDNIPVMTSEASSVLAELKRQRSQVEARRNQASSVSIPRSLKVSGPNERTCCNCKASQCIKRYCPCFATSNFCGPECGCRNCENTLNNSSCVGIARKALMERDPNAFVPRIRSSQRQKARGRQTIRGCNCRKGCEKNYCICKENGLACGVRCTCSGPNGCQNQDQSKLSDVQQVIENMPPLKHIVCQADDAKGMDHSAAIGSTKTKGRDRNDVHMKTENLVPHASPVYVSDLSANTANNVLTGYPALPTPTTPSMPYNPFFEPDRSDKKRSMTFGELSDGFKRIKVADPKDMPLSELKQSSSKYENPSGSRLQTASEAHRFLRIPATSKLPSKDPPPTDGRELLVPNSAASNDVYGNEHLMTDESRSQHLPRILRYKFGSGKSAGTFEFPR